MLLTLLVAVTGAYVVTRLVTNSLEERLTNQLLESGRVVSDLMARQEVKHVESARIIAYTRGLGEAIQKGDAAQISVLVKPAAGGLNAESVGQLHERQVKGRRTGDATCVGVFA